MCIVTIDHNMFLPKTGRELASDSEDSEMQRDCCPNCGHNPCAIETFTYEYVNTRAWTRTLNRYTNRNAYFNSIPRIRNYIIRFKLYQKFLKWADLPYPSDVPDCIIMGIREHYPFPQGPPIALHLCYHIRKKQALDTDGWIIPGIYWMNAYGDGDWIMVDRYEDEIDKSDRPEDIMPYKELRADRL